MWFKNLILYRLNKWDVTPEQLEEKLSALALQPCSGLEMQRTGWVAPKENEPAFVHTLGSQMLFCLGAEKKLLPASVVNTVAKARAVEMEEQQGYKPGRKQMKQIKEAVTDELLPRAFAVRRRTYAWIDTAAGLLVLDAANLAKADELVELLVKSVDGIGFAPLKTVVSPAAAMTAWLAGNDAPAAFTIDRDCELRAAGEEKSTVRYVRHTLEAEEIAKHISGGKEVTKLALTWHDRISFVLHENLQLKRLQALDLLNEQTGSDTQDDAFDADFALMTGELKKLLPALVNALEGEARQTLD
ncbi:MAG: recombination-associated protein RdgC [Gallionella sp.]|nr:recombination-associated protein RdgC [Gallionella sp.]NCS74875.1 recombination-associated protein RdgC [Gallionella sp.]